MPIFDGICTDFDWNTDFLLAQMGSRPNWLRNLPNWRWKKMEMIGTMKTVIGAAAQLHETTKECNLCYRGYRYIRT